MADLDRRQWNKRQIEAHLKSAVSGMTPNVLDRVDLGTPQMTVDEVQGELGAEQQRTTSMIVMMQRRMRVMGALVAACFCMIVAAGGVYTYQNQRVDSVIGIDVNPSVELSVNRKNRVISATALNDDAREIMADMDLKGVELQVAVNAVIGSMVTHGFLDDLDNAILVTVTNDSISKATSLRTEVVGDIQTTLDENQVKAVVYDQQVVIEDDVQQLAKDYSISYGKAYFLKELIDQNSSLTMNDMASLAPLTMEEIAKVITERAYAVGSHATVTEDPTTLADSSEAHTTAPVTTAPTTTVEETTTTAAETSTEEKKEEGPGVSGSKPETLPPALPVETTPAQTAPPEVTTSNNIKIDNTDYDNGVVFVYFKTKVKWKNPTVSVKGEDGTAYSAMLEETESDYCEINVSGLEGGMKYTFVLGGISPKTGKQTTVTGTFETPVFDDGNANDVIEDEDLPETEPTEVPSVPTETKPTVTEPVPPATETPPATAATQASTAQTTAAVHSSK